MDDSTLRRRMRQNTPSQSSTTRDVPSEVEDSGRVISVLDIIRVIITLVGASCALSYYITSGESLLWGQRPWFTRQVALQSWWNGPMNLTPDQLALFNGSEPNMPIYLAINGTIFDVSAGRHAYGPGGSYSVFAGRDATRAFVTGCFLEDRTNDIRGVEEIYIPVDDPEEEITSGEKKTRAEKERRDAKKRVSQEVQNWENFYTNSKKYFPVGKVVGLEKPTGPPPELCADAQKGRPKRKKSAQKSEMPGKPVQ